MRYKVYTLSDPITKEIRYVGITKETLAGRRSKHLTDAKSSKQNHRVHWLRFILKKGLKPIIEELDEASSYEELLKLEVYWIAQLKSWGFRLVNATAGGEGSVGYKHTKQSLALMQKIADSRRKPKKKRLSREEQNLLISKNVSVSVIEYDLNGNKKKEWPSLLEASRFHGISSSAIGHALRDYSRTANNSFWRYAADTSAHSITVVLRKGNKRRVRVEYLTGAVELFKNSQEAQESLGISYPTLMRYIDTNLLFKRTCKLKNY